MALEKGDDRCCSQGETPRFYIEEYLSTLKKIQKKKLLKNSKKLCGTKDNIAQLVNHEKRCRK